MQLSSVVVAKLGYTKSQNMYITLMNNIAQCTESQIDVHQNHGGLRHIKFMDGLLQVGFSRRFRKGRTRRHEVPSWYSPVLLRT